MSKDYIKKLYQLAILDFKCAKNEDEQWAARKEMARLERLALEVYDEELYQQLRKEIEDSE